MAENASESIEIDPMTEPPKTIHSETAQTKLYNLLRDNQGMRLFNLNKFELCQLSTTSTDKGPRDRKYMTKILEHCGDLAKFLDAGLPLLSQERKEIIGKDKPITGKGAKKSESIFLFPSNRRSRDNSGNVESRPVPVGQFLYWRVSKYSRIAIGQTPALV